MIVNMQIVTICGVLIWHDILVKSSWVQFAASRNFINLRTMSGWENTFSLWYISKDVPLTTASMECLQSCGAEEMCLAVNVYESEDFYVCEMVPGNLCLNDGSTTILTRQGSFTWDKLTKGAKVSCLDQLTSNGTVVKCERLRPGCLGDWPNCYNCTKTCLECQKRYWFSGYRNCTLWPDGDAPDSVPILSLCNGQENILIRRKCDLSYKKFTEDYQLSFPNINRLYNLKQYSMLQFNFQGSLGILYQSRYKNSYIEADGTLKNLTYYNGWLDIFNLKSLSLNSTPFVTVTDDRYGCGSFWLIDRTNATYCPGGYTKLFGIPDMNKNPIITGMHFAAGYPTIIYVMAEISLVP